MPDETLTQAQAFIQETYAGLKEGDDLKVVTFARDSRVHAIPPGATQIPPITRPTDEDDLLGSNIQEAMRLASVDLAVQITTVVPRKIDASAHSAAASGSTHSSDAHGSSAAPIHSAVRTPPDWVQQAWANRGNILRGNRFERLYPVEKMSQATAINGVYLDTLEAGWVVENNVFSSMEVGVFIAGGRQNTVTGNRFINCTTPVVLDSVGLTFNCGAAGQCLGASLAQQCGCPANYREELLNVFHYLSPPWSQTFPNISTNMLEGGKSPPVLNTVRNNKWCPSKPNSIKTLNHKHKPNFQKHKS